MAEKVSPWNLGGLTVRELGRRVWNEMSKDAVMDRAAALAYYFVFALFPTLLFLAALLGMFPLPGLMDRLTGSFSGLLPPAAPPAGPKTTGGTNGKARGGRFLIA